LCFGKQQPIVKELIEVSSPYGSFLFKNVGVTSNGVVSGTVENKTSRSWKYVQFLVYVKDKNGKYLKREYDPEHYSLIAGVRSLSKGQAGQIEPREPLLYLGVPGKFTDFEIQFNETNSDFFFSYVFALVTPHENPAPAFNDDTMSITFNPSNQQIAFILKNLTGFPIGLEWDKMAYVDFDGSSHRVIHQGVRLMQKEAPQPSTTVAPGSSVEDFLYPSDRVSWNSTISEWIEAPMWPSIPSPGQKFGIFMPIDINGTIKNYMFTIKVADVQF
jgi:hypothetical protein